MVDTRDSIIIHKEKIGAAKTKPFYILNVSDVHYDSPKCDRTLLKKHFDKAKELGAKIIINGDWFDVMGCKNDPRSTPNDIRPEYMKAGGSYLDLVIEDSAEFLKNYVDNILLISYGNHETNIVKRQQVDPLKYLVDHYLNRHEKIVNLGAYQGAIILKFFSSDTNRYKRCIYYHHGAGGNARRSKGVLDADILIAQNSWADIITSGHDHNKWHLPYVVNTLSSMEPYKFKDRKIDILRTGSYKQKSNAFGWEVEKRFNAPTLGGYWIKFYLVSKKLTTDIYEAK